MNNFGAWIHYTKNTVIHTQMLQQCQILRNISLQHDTMNNLLRQHAVRSVNKFDTFKKILLCIKKIVCSPL